MNRKLVAHLSLGTRAKKTEVMQLDVSERQEEGENEVDG